MGIIPSKIYKTVEFRLRKRGVNAEEALERLEQAKAEAYGLTGVDYSAVRVQSSKSGDVMSERVLRVIEAENAFAEAFAWDSVAARAFEIYPPDSPEGEIAQLIYTGHMSQADVCAALGVDRQTVRRRKDAFVLAAALVAADRGLIRREIGQNG